MTGVGLTGKTRPKNGGNFPVWEDIYGQGGYRTVNTVAERNLFTMTGPLFLKAGMVVYCRSTQCMYTLNEDLANWSFFMPSPQLAKQAAWDVNIASGSDANTGLPGDPIATTEELSRRLCPNGSPWQMAQNTAIAIAAGSYGALELFVAAAEPLTGLTLNVNCAYTSVTDTLTSVINTTSGTQGRITVQNGPLTSRGRIRSISGANAGAVTYGEGALNSATDSFVKQWYPSADTLGSVNVANGTQVAIETLAVTIARPIIQLIERSSQITLRFNDAICPNGLVMLTPQGSGTCIAVGVNISGGRSAGNYRVLNGKISGSTQFANLKYGINGATTFAGCLLTGSILANAPITSNVCNAFDACAISLFNGGAFQAAGGGATSEWVNGAGLTAFTLTVNTFISWANPLSFCFGTPYAVGVAAEGGTHIQLNSAANFVINATQQLVLAGQNFKYADLPLSVGGVRIVLASDPNAVSDTRVSINLAPAARAEHLAH